MAERSEAVACTDGGRETGDGLSLIAYQKYRRKPEDASTASATSTRLAILLWHNVLEVVRLLVVRRRGAAGLSSDRTSAAMASRRSPRDSSSATKTRLLAHDERLTLGAPD